MPNPAVALDHQPTAVHATLPPSIPPPFHEAPQASVCSFHTVPAPQVGLTTHRKADLLLVARCRPNHEADTQRASSCRWATTDWLPSRSPTAGLNRGLPEFDTVGVHHVVGAVPQLGEDVVRDAGFGCEGDPRALRFAVGEVWVILCSVVVCDTQLNSPTRDHGVRCACQ